MMNDEGLDVGTVRRSTARRIPIVSNTRIPEQLLFEKVRIVKDVQDEPEVFVNRHYRFLPLLVIRGRDNSGRLLTPVLKCMQAVVGVACSLGVVVDAKNATMILDGVAHGQRSGDPRFRGTRANGGLVTLGRPFPFRNDETGDNDG